MRDGCKASSKKPGAALIAAVLIPGPLTVPFWTAVPFAGLLLAIAILPLAAPHFWHSNRNRAMVSAFFGVPVAGYLLYLEMFEQQPGLGALWHGVEEYLEFVVMLWALYTIAGG